MERRGATSIKTTLLAIVGVLTILITAQTSFQVYQAWENHQEAEKLQQAALVTERFYISSEYFSLERGQSAAIISATEAEAEKLADDLQYSRERADNALKTGLDILKEQAWADEGLIEDIEKAHASLRVLRARIDTNAQIPQDSRSENFTNLFLNVSTDLISKIHTLIDNYSRPLVMSYPGATRLMRINYLIWGITEYASREYAIIGDLISRNRPPTPEERDHLTVLRGRIEYGWDVAQRAIRTSATVNALDPVLEETRTHYFMTFEQIKDLFYQPLESEEFFYPLSVEMWLELASQAVDSLYELNDAVLKASQSHTNNLKLEAERAIIISLTLFGFALILSAISWWIITRRITRPVNAMAEALYRATRSETYKMPDIAYHLDEIGKLASALEKFQENARQLAEERDRAEAANKAKGEFLANMSHEIRTPMNVVFGVADLLSRSEPLTEMQKEFIDTLHLSAESLLTLINDLLDFSKIETSSLKLESIPIRLDNVIKEIETLKTFKAEEKGLEFNVDFDDIKDRTYLGDPTRIKQVLVNLCGNAIKFTEKGSVTLKVERAEGSGPEHDNIKLSVIDTGIGIEENKLDVIFEKFTQADASTTRKYGGTGLGLAISKSLVDMMGGVISAESTPGKGSTFTVLLPLPLAKATDISSMNDDARKLPKPEKTKRNSRQVPGAHVLLVEDYKPNALVAGSYLKQFGFSYDLAVNGAEAVEYVKERPYAAILMDIQMPELNGYEATRAIRAYEEETGNDPVRIIGVTAHAMPGDREKCLNAGMDDYIPKPINPDELKAKLAS